MENNLDYKINEFVIFCIEIYKAKYKMSGKDVFNLFDEYKVIEYLEKGYDMLHTQGEGWLINDIDEFLKIRGFENKF